MSCAVIAPAIQLLEKHQLEDIIKNIITRTVSAQEEYRCHGNRYIFYQSACGPVLIHKTVVTRRRIFMINGRIVFTIYRLIRFVLILPSLI